MSATATVSNDTASLEGKPDSGLSIGDLKARFNQNTLVPLLIVAAAVVAIVVAALLWAMEPGYSVLYSNLSEADGGSVISELEAQNVPFEISQGGRAIMVPSDQVHTLRLRLAEQGLPAGGKVGFELMDGQAFGVSQFAEQVNFQRGLEGELAESIESLGPVAAARVHLAMPKPSVFVKQREPAKASVILTLHPARSLAEGQVDAIVHLVASSVPELAIDEVSVVDQRGNLLSRAGAAGGRLDATQLSFTGKVEDAYRERIATLLTPLYGAENFRVQVTAQLDFSSREETTEQYAPNQRPDSASVRSSQVSTDFSGDQTLARGIPGALSNSVPGWDEAPADGEEPAADDGETGTDSSRGSLRKDNIVNYELDRSVVHVKHQRGNTERLSVAVVVNYRPEVDDNGDVSMVPLSDTEIEQVRRLVRQAVGFSEARGDQIEVANSLFSTLGAEEPEPLPLWRDPHILKLAASLGRYLLVAVLVALLYFKLLRPLVKRHVAVTAPVAPGAGPGATDASGAAPAEGDAAVDENGEPLFQRPNKGASYSQQLKELRSISEDDPRMIAMIVRNWMADHE